MQRPLTIDIKPYLPHAAAATAAVVLFPLAVLSMLVFLSQMQPPVLATMMVGLGLPAAAAVAGNLVWARRPESVDVPFRELMLWTWLRHVRAERRVSFSAAALARDLPVKDHLRALHRLADALESKDPYTHGHSRRVERHVFRTALRLGLSPEEIDELRTAAFLHDIGKVNVPDAILRKKGSLTPEEYDTVKTHSAIGALLIDGVANPRVVEAVRHHHERWDGRGYPDGLSGTAIPLYARIIAVADTFDAVTSKRPYRPGCDRKKALKIVIDEAGRQFDPSVVKAFAATVSR